MTQPIAHLPPTTEDAPSPPDEAAPAESLPVPVGDVVIRRDESGYGIFNFRGERVLELPMRTSGEAERLAAEIVSLWHGRVRVDLDAR